MYTQREPINNSYMRRVFNSTGQFLQQNKRDLLILTGIAGMFAAGYFMEQQHPPKKISIQEFFGTPTEYQVQPTSTQNKPNTNTQNYFW